MTDNEILLNLAKKNYGKYLTPTGDVSAKKVDRFFTEEEKAKLDTATATNLIGDIINCSQVINSRIWECVKSGDLDRAEELYIITSQLDVMSNLAIDSAKREFPVDLKLELKEIKKNYIDIDLKPKFFEFISKDKGNKVKKENYRWYDTSMDYLIKIIDSASRKKVGDSPNKGITLTDLIKGSTIFNEQSKNNLLINNVVTIGTKSKNEINAIWSTYGISPADKYFKVSEVQDRFRGYLRKSNIKPIDIKKIIYKLERSEEYNKSRKYILGELYIAHPNVFLELFCQKN